MKNIFLALLFFGFVYFILGVTEPRYAQKKLESNGYSNIKLTGRIWFGWDWCGKSATRFTFEAVREGQLRKGYVCSHSPFVKGIYED